MSKALVSARSPQPGILRQAVWLSQ